MCRLKSAIILKDRVFIPDYDSHTDMLRELGIEDNEENAESLFVRAELSPKNGDVFSDVDTWKFVVDQDILPKWFVEPYDKERMIKAVKEWASEHILIGRENLKISNGTYYLKDCVDVALYSNCTVEAYGNSTVKACGNSTVKACGNSTVKACGNSTVEAYNDCTVEAYNDCTVEAYGNSTVKACGNSTIKACGNNTVKAYGNSTVIITNTNSSRNEKDNIILADNATLKDCRTKTIYQSGDWQFVKVTL